MGLMDDRILWSNDFDGGQTASEVAGSTRVLAACGLTPSNNW